MNFTEQDHRDLVASFPRVKGVVPLVIGMLLCLSASIGSFVSAAGKARGNEFALVLGGAGLIGAVILGIRIGVKHQRVRTECMTLVAQRFGLDCRVSPSKQDRAALFAPFTPFSMLRGGARNLKLWFGGTIDDRRVDLIQHTYVVSTGKSAHAVNHTLTATPVPTAWPRVTLTPQRSLAGWWASITGADLKLENEAFNARWLVRTDHPDFALLLLGPEVQAFLAEAPNAETWQVGNGLLARIVRAQSTPRDIPYHITRTLALRQVIAPELDYWGA